MTSEMEMQTRLGCFLSVLIAMFVWQAIAPRRKYAAVQSWRWTNNLILVVINAVVARLLVPITAVGMAVLGQSRGWGLLSLVDWPSWLEILTAVIAFDLAIYLQHVMFHAVPLFWRLHLVHHADLDFDVTTGLRFHTLEIVLSAFIKLAAVLVIGPSAVAVVVFEVLLNATSMFNHSNIRLPERWDRILRLVVVTPDMHRVHHSVIRRETDSNFGFNLPWWDHLLGTYRSQPAAGHEGMTIGLEDIRDELVADRLPQMLWLPVSAPVDSKSPVDDKQ